MPFNRPNLPYISGDLPNNTRFEDITNSTPNNIVPASIFDIDINCAFDSLNALETTVNNIGAGILPGSDNPLNNNKVVIIDNNTNISYVFISDQNILPRGISSLSLANNCVNNNILGNASVTTNKILDLSITQQKLALLSVGNQQIIDLSITNSKIAANTITAEQIAANTITAEQIAANTITAEQIAANTITAEQIAQAVLDMFVPIGTVIEFAGTTGMPANFIECVGGTVLIETYPTYFANVGTLYGGDGVTTVGIPDRRGRSVVGIGSDDSTGGLITNATAPNITLGATGVFGFEQITLDLTQIPSHNHSTSNSGSWFINSGPNPPLVSTAAFAGGNTGNKGGGLPHNNTQPSIFARFYIRVL
jgi:microcystin-dependent protein